MKQINLKVQAFSLIELSIAMAVVAVFAAATLPVAIRTFEIKAAEKTALEMALIQDAARNYYANKNKWPDNPAQLQVEGYLSPDWDILNPWKLPYIIDASLVSTLKVVTNGVPQGVQNMVISRLPMGLKEKDGIGVSSSISAPGVTPAGVASGVIVAWSGSIANIPSGWVLCDGDPKTGAPDLRDKFIIGANSDVSGRAMTNVTGAPTGQGGAVNHDHGGKTGDHQLTVAEMPSHQHAGGYGEVFTELAPFGVAWKYGGGQWGSANTDRDNYQWLTDSVGGNQAHSHTIANANHLPPYYALAFIMKV